MCGLVGVAGLVDLDVKKVMENLLVMDQLRGKHSVGVASMNHNGRVSVLKKAIPVADYLDLKQWADLKLGTVNCMIGHNRYATQGAINSNNAHPFTHGTITGAHNGTLRNQWLLPDANMFDVDSDNIMHAINEQGMRQTAGELDGAFALTWWDTETNKLFMCRNDERSLFYAYANDRKTLIWASEMHMLIAATHRNGLEIEGPYDVAINKLHAFAVPLGFQAQAKPFPKVVVSELPVYVRPPVVRQQKKQTVPSTQEKRAALTSVPNQQAKPTGTNTTPSKTGVSGIAADYHTDLVTAGFLRSYKVDPTGPFDVLLLEEKHGQLVGFLMAEGSTEDLEVRIAGLNPIVRTKMLEHDGFFRARKATGFKKSKAGDPGVYLSISAKHCLSLKWTDMLDEKEDYEILDEEVNGNLLPVTEPTVSYPDDLGHMVESKEWHRRYKNCASCSSPLDVNDNFMVLFCHNEGVCGDCRDMPVVQEHLHSMGVSNNDED